MNEKHKLETKIKSLEEETTKLRKRLQDVKREEDQKIADICLGRIAMTSYCSLNNTTEPAATTTIL